MAQKKATKKAATRKPAAKKAGGFSAEEREAMREYMAEKKGGGVGESEVLAKIAALPPADRALAEKVHAIVKANAPGLTPKTWYGMPAYAKGDKVVCFFQSAHKFKARYATLGFSDKANLDEGNTWPVAFALKTLTAADEKKIADLVKKAVR